MNFTATQAVKPLKGAIPPSSLPAHCHLLLAFCLVIEQALMKSGAQQGKEQKCVPLAWICALILHMRSGGRKAGASSRG